MKENYLNVNKYLATYSVNPDINDKTFEDHLINYIFCVKQIAYTINDNELSETGIQQILMNKRILDVGCGEGFGSHFLNMLGANVVGIDLHKGIVKYANDKYSNNNCIYQFMDATDLSFEENSFDAVIGMDIVEHIDAPHKLINELSRVSKPEAPIFLLTPNYLKHAFLLGGIYPFHVREYTTDSIVELCDHNFNKYKIFSKNVGYIEEIGKKINGNSMYIIIAQKLKSFIKKFIPQWFLISIKANRIKNKKLKLSDVLNSVIFKKNVFDLGPNQTASDFMIIGNK